MLFLIHGSIPMGTLLLHNRTGKPISSMLAVGAAGCLDNYLLLLRLGLPQMVIHCGLDLFGSRDTVHTLQQLCPQFPAFLRTI